MKQPLYSQEQVYDSLLRQGFSEDQATAMAMAVGSTRRTPEELARGYNAVGIRGAQLPSGDDGAQGSNVIPNLMEGTLGTLAYHKLKDSFPSANLPTTSTGLAGILDKTKKGALRGAKWGIPGIAGNIGNIAGTVLSGTNYYDRATMPQIAADIGGSVGGGILGDMAGRAAGAAAGRLAGGTLGAAAGPIGSILGATLGGWLLPKLLPDGSKPAKSDPAVTKGEPDDSEGWGRLAAMGLVGGLAVPKVRSSAKQAYNYLSERNKKILENPLGAD